MRVAFASMVWNTGSSSPGELEPVFDFSYDGALRSLEASLDRLGTDHVDVLLTRQSERTTGMNDVVIQNARVLAVEHRIYPLALKQVAEGSIKQEGQPT